MVVPFESESLSQRQYLASADMYVSGTASCLCLTLSYKLRDEVLDVRPSISPYWSNDSALCSVALAEGSKLPTVAEGGQPS